MTALAGLLAAVTVAFPRAGAKLPPVSSSYAIGAVDRSVTNLVIQGVPVAVHRTGAWAAMLSVREGTNTVAIVADGVETNLTFTVAPRPAPAASAQPPPKKRGKIPYAADTPRPHPAGKPLSEITVVLDPGHGGADAGALSPHGFFEKNANLAMARDVRRALEERGVRAILTREDDRALVLGERPRVAHDNGADAFVSLHHNAPAVDRDARTARYAAVYAWNPVGTRLATGIAARLAAALDGEPPCKGVLPAEFAVIRNPEIPSCLVEIDFITSPEGEEAIWSPPRRRRIAAAIADGLVDWIGSRP